MIPLRYLEEWQEKTSWATYAQTEQDLLIVRALIEMFSDDFFPRIPRIYLPKNEN
jgi:hypothetical protein